MKPLTDFSVRVPKKVIFVSFVLAMMADFIPVSGSLYWLPELTLLVLIYWLAGAPNEVQLGTAFTLGLLVDIGTNAPLGAHALAYLLPSYLIIVNHRQFGVQNYGFQGLLVILAVGLAELILAVVFWWGTNRLPEWSVLAAPLVGAVLWLLINRVMSMYLNHRHY